MPQCLTPEFETKSASIVELLPYHSHHQQQLHSSTKKYKSIEDKLSGEILEYDVSPLGSVLDSVDSSLVSDPEDALYHHHHYRPEMLAKSSNSSFSPASSSSKSETLPLSSSLDDYVYLEFYVDSIRPDYSSGLGSSTTGSSNVTFGNCYNNFKLLNGTVRGHRLIPLIYVSGLTSILSVGIFCASFLLN